MTRRFADRPALGPLWDELARRYAASDQPVAAVTLRDLDAHARRALADLLGSDRLPNASCRVTTTKVAAALGLSNVDELRPMVEELRGPLGNRTAERARRLAEREAMWDWFTAQVDDPRLDGWVTRVRSAGVPASDVEAHRARLARVLAVLTRLPADGCALASLANDVLDDPHALDRGRWITSVVLDAVAARVDRPVPRSAEEARAMWAAVGVVADPLSPTVLLLGLRAGGDGAMAGWLRAAADASEPCVLTLSQLQRWPVSSVAGDTAAFVVENPSLLAEAAGRGWVGPPLICTSGWPTVAVLTLLRQLAACGLTLHQHADFDPTGIELTAFLAKRVGTRPWRMNASDYVAGVGRATVSFDRVVPGTPWDPDLAEVMRAHGRPVYEEDVRDRLLLHAAAGDA